MKINVTIFAIIALVCIEVALGCPRAPRDLPHGRRKRGDNGYKLSIGDNPSGYVPGKIYNLFLYGARTHNKIQQFTHFKLTAEAANGSKRPTVASPRRVGRFQLFGDSLAKFNEECINTVSEVDDLPKTEIQVMWVAPETGSGCVALSAMIYENAQSWYSDDGELTKVICEKKLEKEEAKKECCACDEAKYSFVFEGIWSNETHPKDYPFAIWLTHFSDVVGASHESNFSFWGENHIATDGFRSLAEWGSPSALEAELRTYGPRLRTLIKAAGLWYPDVNTNTSSHFRVDRKHHKVSLVSMFGPSPDWVVGVSGLDLCLEDCSWKDSLDLDLFPWDSGTDSGISYMSPNLETIPREKMYRITTMYPEDPRAPFYNPNSDKMTPLAKLYIRREKVIPRSCDEEFLEALQLDVAENTEDQDVRPECAVTEYTAWTPCSVSCGKGLRKRTRQYVNPEKAKMASCNRQLISKEMCVAPVPECENQESDDDEGENLAKSQLLVGDNGEGIGVCRTNPWSDWSECSNTCGIGITMRTRTFVNHLGRKKCPHVTIVEKQKCMKPDCTFEKEELPDPMCPVTIWSDWSPCSATCGKGVTIRRRLLKVDPELEKTCSERLDLFQQRECTVKESCRLDNQSKQEICSELPEIGPCRGSFKRFAYNQQTNTCEEFMYGGCRGSRNNFLTNDDCMQTCSRKDNDDSQSTRPPALVGRAPQQPDRRRGEPVDCQVSMWSEWSLCSASCGPGIRTRTRQIFRRPRNGGLPCPRTHQRQKCEGDCSNA